MHVSTSLSIHSSTIILALFFDEMYREGKKIVLRFTLSFKVETESALSSFTRDHKPAMTSVTNSLRRRFPMPLDTDSLTVVVNFPLLTNLRTESRLSIECSRVARWRVVISTTDGTATGKLYMRRRMSYKIL